MRDDIYERLTQAQEELQFVILERFFRKLSGERRGKWVHQIFAIQ